MATTPLMTRSGLYVDPREDWLAQRSEEIIDPGRPIAVLCASGQRAATAASLLQRFGAEQVIHVAGGGVPAWGRLGRELVSS